MAGIEEQYCTVIESDGEIEPYKENQTWNIVETLTYPGRIELSVESENGGWLVVRDTWYPGWVGRVDGDRVEIYKADYLFRSIPVSAGEHIVEMRYQPKSFTIGVIFSMIGVAVLLCINWKMKRAV